MTTDSDKKFEEGFDGVFLSSARMCCSLHAEVFRARYPIAVLIFMAHERFRSSRARAVSEAHRRACRCRADRETRRTRRQGYGEDTRRKAAVLLAVARAARRVLSREQRRRARAVPRVRLASIRNAVHDDRSAVQASVLSVRLDSERDAARCDVACLISATKSASGSTSTSRPASAQSLKAIQQIRNAESFSGLPTRIAASRDGSGSSSAAVRPDQSLAL